MKIPKSLKDRLLSELDFVIQRVSEEQGEAQKIFFLSAAHGAIERAMRFHSEGELKICHAVLNVSYSALHDRYNRLKSGDTVVPLPKNWDGAIVEHLSELRDLISRDQQVYPALERIMDLAYSVTGPGYYTMSYLESLTTR